jgi:hypothetical protein
VEGWSWGGGVEAEVWGVGAWVWEGGESWVGVFEGVGDEWLKQLDGLDGWLLELGNVIWLS